MIFKNKLGASLLLAISFSVVLLVSASFISAALVSAQKNLKNIENYNIAFFAAEAGIEEALYYNSFHAKGFECIDSSAECQESSFEISDYARNVYYDWDIDGRIDISECPEGTSYSDSDDQCKGTINFGESAAINFSYDNSTPSTTGTDIYTEPDSAKIVFSHDLDPGDLVTIQGTDENNQANNGDKIVLTWLGSYIQSGAENRLFPLHNIVDRIGYRFNGSSYIEGDPTDCAPATTDGKYICQEELANAGNAGSEITFNFDAIQQGFVDNDDTDPATLQNFFSQNLGAPYKETAKIKFFYIELIRGLNVGDPDLARINYTISPPSNGDDIVATKTVISAKGRAKNILNTLEVKINNTSERTLLDYSTLLQ